MSCIFILDPVPPTPSQVIEVEIGTNISYRHLYLVVIDRTFSKSDTNNSKLHPFSNYQILMNLL